MDFSFVFPYQILNTLLLFNKQSILCLTNTTKRRVGTSLAQRKAVFACAEVKKELQYYTGMTN